MRRILLFILLLPILTFGQKECVINVITDNYPSETYWCLYADSLYGDTILHTTPGYYTSPSTSYSDTCYISDTTTTIVFLMRDAYGDGMSGSYYVTVCEDTIVNKPTVTFTTGLYSTRLVPQCMPNPPPPGSCVPAIVNINLDQFQSETTWDIKDSTGSLLYAGGPYSTAPDYQPQFETVCLPIGNLTFTIYDAYGDGLAGSLWGGNDGSYYVMQCGDTLVYGTIANFGTDSTHSFVSDTCTPPPPVPGCMDPNYIEYDPLATISDSSCLTLKIYGCVDTSMFNYNPGANTMDYIDSCMYTLVLFDLAGNGWVGSKLEIYQGGDTSIYNLTSGFYQTYTLMLNAPEEVTAKFFISSQASMTSIECGFLLFSSTGDTTLYVAGGFSDPMLPFHDYIGTTYCGNTCITTVVGCMDTTAYNYDSLANTSNVCYYSPGCTSPAYLEYYTQGYVADVNDGSCNVLAVFGCMDSTAFNYDTTANVDNGGCVPVILGCMNTLAFNYNPNANTPDTCIPLIHGCTDPTMFNYCDSCNTDDGSCEPYIFGCTDSTMFNYNPLANADNSSCIPFIYGCTDPSMLNYVPQANTEDFSCIPYIYGCTDSTAFNYDSTANTDNGSCVVVVKGCTDQNAYNYNQEANVNDSASCLYNANCITGPGNPYWLNDPCYAWVIDVDDYCCENEWDTICQLTYLHCSNNWSGPPPSRRSFDDIKIYPNPTNGKININSFVDVCVFNTLGDVIIRENNINVLDVARLHSGIYNIQIVHKNKIINKKIIKK